MQFQESNSKTFAVDRGVMGNVSLISFVQGWLKVTSSNSTYGLIKNGQKIYLIGNHFNAGIYISLYVVWW